MLLYHFTSRSALRSILRTGLSHGSIPGVHGFNAVWLTTDPGPSGHGLEAGGAMMTEAQRQQAYEWSGERPPPGTRLPKPAEMRIAVDLDPADRNLHEWLPWARRRLAPDLVAQLHPIGTPVLRKAKGWRLYFGVIAPESFVSVDPVAEPADDARRGLEPAVGLAAFSSSA